MRLDTIMTRDVEIVQPDAPLQIAAQKMRDRDVGSLPVVEQGQVVGIITDRDITVRAVAAGFDPRTTRVRNLATTEVIWCYPDQDVEKGARLMEDYQIRRLVILDNKTQQLVGIISLADIAQRAAAEKSAQILEKVSEPAAAN
jgi:CBS domain-containing protein